jgi:magnesium-transporting ATPase (P-type)
VRYTGNVANSGTHALNGSGAATVLRIGPNTTLAGTGTLALSDSTAN